MKQTLNLEQKALKFTELKALNEQELRETEGGWLLHVLGAVAAVYTAVEIADFIVTEYVHGWNNPR